MHARQRAKLSRQPGEGAHDRRHRGAFRKMWSRLQCHRFQPAFVEIGGQAEFMPARRWFSLGPRRKSLQVVYQAASEQLQPTSVGARIVAN